MPRALSLRGRGARACTRATAPRFATFNGMHIHTGKLPGAQKTSTASFFDATSRAIAASSNSGATKQVATMMPVGVPRVPYRPRGSNQFIWIDIWNCLYRDRIVFLSKSVDDELGNELVATLLYLDSENRNDINIYMNVSGGDVVPTLALHDTFKHVKSDVATVGFGGVMGMAGFLLACGKKGKRYALEHTSIMLHHPSGTARGQADDVHNEGRELLRIRDYMDATLSVATGRSFDAIQEDLERVLYMTPIDAVEYGVIDRILKPKLKRKMMRGRR